MKISYEVSAGADPSDIKLEYEGADDVYIDADGSLVIEAPGIWGSTRRIETDAQTGRTQYAVSLAPR